MTSFWLFIFKKLCKSTAPSKSNKQKVNDKIAGSGSISQRHGSADPDPKPYQMSWIRNIDIYPWRPPRERRPSYTSCLQCSIGNFQHFKTIGTFLHFFLFIVGHVWWPGSGSSRPKSMRIWINTTEKTTHAKTGQIRYELYGENFPRERVPDLRELMNKF